MLRKLLFLMPLALSVVGFQTSAYSQNIFSGEPVQVVGQFNGYATTPYNADYRTATYRRVTTNTGTPVDGRGQWVTTINVQNSGGDVTPVNMPGGGGNGFLFISGPSANRFQNKWVFSGIGQATVGGLNNISCFNCGNDMGLNMNTPGYYTFVFSDAGYTQTNARFYVAYTTNAPVTVTRAGQTVNPGGSITVNITTSVTPSPQENIYVRYTTGADFSGTGVSNVVQATGSGTSYSATIPAQTPGQTIRYFVFSSTRSLVDLSFTESLKSALAPAATETEKNISVLRADDNGGANYTQIAPSAASVSLGGRVLTASGNGISRATVFLTNQQGVTRSVVTNSFGNYQFTDLSPAESYFLTVRHKFYQFNPQTVFLTEDSANLDLIAFQ